MLIDTIFFILASGVLTGFVCANIVDVFFTGMSHGHIFFKVRRFIARSAAKEVDKEVWFDGVVIKNEDENEVPIEHKADAYDQLFSITAEYNPKFTLWLCPFCMSARVSSHVGLVVSFIGVPLGLNFGIGIAGFVFMSLLTALISLSVSNFFTTYLNN